MLCDNCGKPAVVHVITLFSNDKQVKKHLCEECAGKIFDMKNLSNGKAIQDLLVSKELFEGLMASILEQLVEEDVGETDRHLNFLTCEGCGLNYAELKKNGKLGCEKCYRVFYEQMAELVENINGRTEHAGKIPDKFSENIAIRHKIKQLRQVMQRCVEKEEYEKAAEVRDELKTLVAISEKSLLEVPIDAN